MYKGENSGEEKTENILQAKESEVDEERTAHKAKLWHLDASVRMAGSPTLRFTYDREADSEHRHIMGCAEMKHEHTKKHISLQYEFIFHCTVWINRQGSHETGQRVNMARKMYLERQDKYIFEHGLIRSLDRKLW